MTWERVAWEFQATLSAVPRDKKYGFSSSGLEVDPDLCGTILERAWARFKICLLVGLQLQRADVNATEM